MPGFGIPCPEPDTSPIVESLNLMGNDLWDIVSQLLGPLNECLSGCDVSCKSVISTLKRALNAKCKNIKSELADISSLVPIDEEADTSTSPEETNFLPGGGAAGIGSGTAVGSRGVSGIPGTASYGIETQHATPYITQPKVDASRPDMFPAEVVPATPSTTAGETVGTPETTASTASEGGGETTEATSGPETSIVDTTDVLADDTTDLPEATEGDVPGPAEEWDIADVTTPEIGIPSGVGIQSEVGGQPPTSYNPIMFGD